MRYSLLTLFFSVALIYGTFIVSLSYAIGNNIRFALLNVFNVIASALLFIRCVHVIFFSLFSSDLLYTYIYFFFRTWFLQPGHYLSNRQKMANKQKAYILIQNHWWWYKAKGRRKKTRKRPKQEIISSLSASSIAYIRIYI